MKALHHPDRSDLQLTSVLYALSDPIRIRLVATLVKMGEGSCGCLELPIVKSTLSHHMRTLRESGITRTRIQGTQRLQSIRHEDLEARFPGLLQTILQAYETSTGEAAAYPLPEGWAEPGQQEKA
ncbi:ArsR/SmtB family transcription factor [Paenibacillus methanolicus]|uniref:ArsR/SmtB family transcription factor n=1 Tax=Paenibacillus methanolicus TaxID=582686 RepID=UPI001FEBB5A1|nr:transcriptional regulator [Paenibacillus methanolicus]